MLRKLFEWTCSGQNCEGRVVAAHRPRACPECRSGHALRLARRVTVSLKYLVCRKCEAAYGVAFRLKRCACGNTKFRQVKHEEFFQAKSAAWRKATGRPASRGPIPIVDHLLNKKFSRVQQRRRD